MYIDSYLHRKSHIFIFKRKKILFKEVLCFNPFWPCGISEIAVEYLKSLVRCNEIFMLR